MATGWSGFCLMQGGVGLTLCGVGRDGAFGTLLKRNNAGAGQVAGSFS